MGFASARSSDCGGGMWIWLKIPLACGAAPIQHACEHTVISEMAPVKSSERTLPITPLVRPYFERHLELQKEQKRFAKQSGNPYFDNDLVFAKPNGAPKRRERISANLDSCCVTPRCPHPFHDLRHTAATNMHQLTGDFIRLDRSWGTA